MSRKMGLPVLRARDKSSSNLGGERGGAAGADARRAAASSGSIGGNLTRWEPRRVPSGSRGAFALARPLRDRLRDAPGELPGVDERADRLDVEVQLAVPLHGGHALPDELVGGLGTAPRLH